MKQKLVYCQRCGSLIGEDKICTGCNKKFFSLKRMFRDTKKIFLIVSVVLNVFLLPFGIVQTQKYTKGEETSSVQAEKIAELEHEKTLLEMQVSNTKSKIKKINDELVSAQEALMEKQMKINNLNAKISFYDEVVAFTTVSGHGYAYHKYDCFHISGRDTYYWLVDDVKRQGYSACLDCH